MRVLVVVLCVMASIQLAHSCNLDQFSEAMQKICPCLNKPSSATDTSTKSPSTSPEVSKPSSGLISSDPSVANNNQPPSHRPNAQEVNPDGPSGQNAVAKSPQNGPDGSSDPNPSNDPPKSLLGEAMPQASSASDGQPSPKIPESTCKEIHARFGHYDIRARSASVSLVNEKFTISWESDEKFKVTGVRIRDYPITQLPKSLYSFEVIDPASEIKLLVKQEGMFAIYVDLEDYNTAITDIFVTALPQSIHVSSAPQDEGHLFTWNAINNADLILIQAGDDKSLLAEAICHGSTTQFKLKSKNKAPINIWVAAVVKEGFVGWGSV